MRRGRVHRSRLGRAFFWNDWSLLTFAIGYIGASPEILQRISESLGAVANSTTFLDIPVEVTTAPKILRFFVLRSSHHVQFKYF